MILFGISIPRVSKKTLGSNLPTLSALTIHHIRFQLEWSTRQPSTMVDFVGCADIKVFLHTMGKSIGPPWQAKHKLAAAALAATWTPQIARQ
jgi:hypothetical protein